FSGPRKRKASRCSSSPDGARLHAKPTEANLRKAGYDGWGALIMRPAGTSTPSAADYKAPERVKSSSPGIYDHRQCRRSTERSQRVQCTSSVSGAKSVLPDSLDRTESAGMIS